MPVLVLALVLARALVPVSVPVQVPVRVPVLVPMRVPALALLRLRQLHSLRLHWQRSVFLSRLHASQDLKDRVLRRLAENLLEEAFHSFLR